MQDRLFQEPPLTRAEEIRMQLADAIVRGHLAPGMPLDETEIARQYNVSRTPVREAIRQLEATGLAEARPRRGAVVAAVTKQRLDEMFSVMLELEALCAREASIKMTVAEITALERLHARGNNIAKKGDIEAYQKHNISFHDALYNGSHNHYLAETTTGVRKRLAPFRQAQFSGTGRLLGSQTEHGEIVAAIVDRNGERAAAAMRAHIQTVRETYRTLVPRYGAI